MNYKITYALKFRKIMFALLTKRENVIKYTLRPKNQILGGKVLTPLERECIRE